jgi:hypothetical protein
MSILGIFAAAIAAWGFGAAYYGFMGKIWLDAVGFPPEVRARIESGGKMDPTPFILSFVAELLMAAVFSGVMFHFSPPGIAKGAIIGATFWLGFVVTTMITNNAYAMRPLKLTAIDSFHWLGVLIIMGAVLGAFG